MAPKKKILSDENSHAKSKVPKDSSSTTALPRPDGVPVKKRKILLLGNSQSQYQYPTQERVFAREIENFVGGARALRHAPTDGLGFGLGEPSLLNQIAADFEAIDIQDIHATQKTAPLHESSSFAVTDPIFKPSSLFPYHGSDLSSQSTNTCPVCKRNRTETFDHESSDGSQFQSNAIPCLCRRRRSSNNASDRFKLSASFHSASIVSRSTPFPTKFVQRPIRPLLLVDDESSMHFCYSSPNISSGSGKGLSVDNHDHAEAETNSQSTKDGGDIDIMTQLASQLSEVTLSPCIIPAADDLAETFEEEIAALSLESTLPQAPLKGRLASFSLGYIPAAFPEEIDIKDLRITF